MAHREPVPALKPLAWLYGFGIAVRNLCYDRKLIAAALPELPVISIGNIIAGGSGKTPFARVLSQELRARGKRPVILSRGYGGSDPGPTVVSAQSSVERVGDEAVMQASALSSEAAVVVSRVRATGVALARREDIGDIVILDDGFQHRALARHANILLIDVSSPNRAAQWQSGELLPAGWLREPLTPAMKRADALVLVVKSAILPEEGPLLAALPEACRGVPAFVFQLSTDVVLDARTQEQVSLENLREQVLVGVTAIADPESFWNSASELGLSLTERFAYPDHSLFTSSDADRWLQAAKAPQQSEDRGITFFCTEKDVVKVLGAVPEHVKVAYAPLKGRFLSIESREKFFDLLEQLLQRSPRS